ncbi:sensor histidine kinase [Streptomyces sp. NPDC004539]|uniref:sensor histidine kinase n=1 Tax=Streptomyces sp. NPDC004539 TaxID=3154280 RepID=UPI0033B8D2D5
MSDRRPAAQHWLLDHLAHGAFALVVVAGLVRAAAYGGPLCRDIVVLSVLLALVYAGGLAVGGRWGPGTRRVWVASLVALWTGLVLRAPVTLTDAYVWAAIPLACAALRALDRRGSAVAVGVVTVSLVGQLVRGSGDFTPEVLVPVAAVWGTVALYGALQREADRRRLLVEELRATRAELARRQREAGVLAERERIARDLHDTLAQELAGGVMLLQAAERDWRERPDVALTRVRAAADGLHANLAETRRIISDLTPSAVDEAGLAGALRLLCARAETEGAAARVSFRTTGAACPVLDGQAAATLFRIAQSSLANIREHARAVNVQVTLHQRADGAELEIRDDGRGFDRVPDRPAPARGYGLPAARARLRECGGALDVYSAPGHGTRVCASVPAERAGVR